MKFNKMRIFIIHFIFDCFISCGSFINSSKNVCSTVVSFENNHKSVYHENKGKTSNHSHLGSYNSYPSCHQNTCGRFSFNSFNCKCQNNNESDVGKECISTLWLCDGIADCKDGEDEVDCHCSDDQFQCSSCDPFKGCNAKELRNNTYQCIPLNQTNDGISQCWNHKDEIIEKEEYINDSNKFNGCHDCPLVTPNDECNCSRCPSFLPIPCDCNKEGRKCIAEGHVCFRQNERCDGRLNCIDGSDELNCLCQDDEFQCQCFKSDPIKCSKIYPRSKRCIPLSKYHDGNKDCPDGSDETQYENIVKCGDCNVTLRRLSSVDKYNELEYVTLVSEELNFKDRDSSLCFNASSLNCDSVDCNITDLICTSLQSCNLTLLYNNPMQCEDGTLILANNFCDGKYDCPDFSDENIYGTGFRCSGASGTCVLSQRNLYDNVPQCNDQSDLNCMTDCFKCLDNRLLISSKQVCDGIFDCYDLSDECLCQINVDNTLCNSLFPAINTSTMECLNTNVTNIEYELIKVSCRTKYQTIYATLCDGRPECRDYSDECNCENPPAFCHDPCHKFYPMGDRYCDGLEDEAWKFINDSKCSKGFDEINCGNRFTCKAGNYVSVDVIKKCDGINDCDQGEDENYCSQIKLFSSNEEMIANTGLRAGVWIMSLVVICGNIYIIVTLGLYFKITNDNKGIKLYHLIILNISIADVIMGIYLLIISIYSATYSGFYGKVDHEWRSSLTCSIVGSLTIISSQTSCLMMVLLATFRLYQFLNPFKILSVSSTRQWIFGIILSWLFSIFLAVFPMFHSYFVQEIWFSNYFMRNVTWDKLNITNVACRLAQLTNKTINDNGRDWESTKSFLEKNFPEYAPKGEFGYYGETSVCMPRFYAGTDDKAWEYSLFIITLNFISFLYIAVCYIYILKKATKRKHEIQRNARAKEDKRMQNRITRIIFTDFCCWIPICITSYVKVSGHDVPNEFYIYSAAILLPINSALNPFLFSKILDKFVKFLRKNKKSSRLG